MRVIFFLVALLGYFNLVTAIMPRKLLAAGFYHSAAIQPDQKVFAWGEGLNGELGNGQQLSQVCVCVCLVCICLCLNVYACVSL
jgi:hypothetical protein